MVSNPRCLISQIAVTFDEGDRAGLSSGTGPVRGGSVCSSFFADVYRTDPAVPSSSEQILF